MFYLQSTKFYFKSKNISKKCHITLINKNSQSNVDHEVYEKQAGSQHMQNTENKVDLGWHSSC